MRGALLASALLLVLAVCNGQQLNKVLFTPSQVQQYGARCLDGSPSGYYFAAGAENAKWVLYMQGGGACFDQASCTARSKTDLGSSKGWKQTVTDSHNLLSFDAGVNPDFHNWTKVYIPYCGGDVHVGQRRAADPSTWGLYFAGHLTVTAVVSELMRGTLAQAKELLVSGSSAGGIGAFSNADFIAGMLPNTAVKATPQGGWFFPNASTYADWRVNKTTHRNDTVVKLWQSYLHPACVAAFPPEQAFQCFSLDVLYPFIKTPLFVAEDQFDTNQIFVQLGCPKNAPDTPAYIKYFGASMLESVAQVAASRSKPGAGDALFLPACLLHTENLDLTSGVGIGGARYRDLLGDWYYGRLAPGKRIIYEDSCPTGFPCNPTCSS